MESRPVVKQSRFGADPTGGGQRDADPRLCVLLTTMGGVAASGVDGLVIGPVVAAMFLAAWHVFDGWRRDQSTSIAGSANPG